jgi:hypothetical protein
MTTQEFLWEQVIKSKADLERVCALPLNQPNRRGSAKAIAECRMQQAYSEWLAFVTR